MSLFSRLFPARRPVRPAATARLTVDALEDRDVPSATALDLTAAGRSGQINGAVFTQVRPQPTGTGVIDSFVRVQAQGNGTVEAGYNTGARPLAYDENNSPQFTRSLRVADVPAVTINGVRHRVVLLDINQKASASQLSLDELRVYVSNNGALSGKLSADGTLPGAALKYDMGAGNWVKLDARLSTGSGSGDMTFAVPEAALAGGEYLYLYSKFGARVAANGGFEEWATQGAGGGTVVPPAADPSRFTGTVYLDADGNSGGSTANVADFESRIQGARVYLLIDLNGDGDFADAGENVDDTTIADGTFTFRNQLLTTQAHFEVHIALSTVAGTYQLVSAPVLSGTVGQGQTVTSLDFFFYQAPDDDGGGEEIVPE